MSRSPMQGVIEALETCGSKRNGRLWQCPAHDDKTPSLAVEEGNEGRALLHCHAGCTTEDVVRELGLQMSDLSVKEPRFSEVNEIDAGTPLDSAVAEYVYVTTNCNPTIKVTRFEGPDGKTFRVQHHDGEDWVNGLGGHERVLYNLDHIDNADPSVPVFVVEGEKDADRLSSLGLTVTTSMGGARAANRAPWTPLSGRRVVILPDNDDEGKGYAKVVSQLCSEVGATEVRVLELPGLSPKGDVSDWLDAGHTVDDLSAMVDAAPICKTRIVRPSTFTASQLMDMEIPPEVWVVAGVLLEGFTLVAGKPKMGKSWLALCLAIAVASNRSALGKLDVVPGEVLYLALEDGPKRLKKRLTHLLGSRGLAPSTLHFSTDWARLDEGGEDRLRGWLEDHPNARMVIIDTLERVRSSSGRRSKLAYSEDVAVGARLQKIASDFNVAIIAIHHLRKEGADDALDTVSGTTGLTASADSILILKRDRGKPDAVLAITGRDVEEQELALKFENGLWTLIGPADQYRMSETRQKVREVLQDGGGTMHYRTVAELAGLKEDSAKVTLGRMVDAGQIMRCGNGEYSVIPVTPVTALPQNPEEGPPMLHSKPLGNSGNTSNSNNRNDRVTVNPTLREVGRESCDSGDRPDHDLFIGYGGRVIAT